MLTHTDHSIRGTLALAQGRVLAVTQTGQVLALARTTGRVIWSRKLRGYPHRWIYTGPAVVGRMVIAGTGTGGIESFSLGSGAPRWRWAFCRDGTDGRAHYTTPVCVGDAVAVVGLHHGVVCIDAVTGSVRWRCDLGCDMRHPEIIVNRGRLFVAASPAAACKNAPQCQPKLVWHGKKNGALTM